MADPQNNSHIEYASFFQRLGAFLVDVVPVTLVVAAVFYLFFGFDKVVDRYLARGPRDIEARAAFLEERNTVRNYAGMVFVIYAAIWHASPWQATPGKLLFGIRVVDAQLGRIGWRRSLRRSVTMMLSIIPACIGCLAMLWSKTNQTWHDRIAETYEVKSRSLEGPV